MRSGYGGKVSLPVQSLSIKNFAVKSKKQEGSVFLFCHQCTFLKDWIFDAFGEKKLVSARITRWRGLVVVCDVFTDLDTTIHQKFYQSWRNTKVTIEKKKLQRKVITFHFIIDKWTILSYVL